MGISFAKSIKFGAVRFNFSGGGIGMSVGIPGLRIGTGPRGAYIAGGAAGFRYRKSLGASPPAARAPKSPQSGSPSGHRPTLPTSTDPNIVATVHHEALNILELSDSSSDSLLQSMNEQRNKAALWPVVGGSLAVIFFVLWNLSAGWNGIVLPSIFALFFMVTWWVKWRDDMRRLTVLFFEPDPEASHFFDRVASAAGNAFNVSKLKSIAQTSTYSNTKYSAGASEGLKFEEAKFFLGQAPGVAANIEVPILQTSKTTLAFYPDRILAFQGKSVGAIGYKELEATCTRVRQLMDPNRHKLQ